MFYIVSNVKCSKDKVNELVGRKISEDDTIVFLNKADNYELFKGVKAKKWLICAESNREGDYFVRPQWRGHELEHVDFFSTRERLMPYLEFAPEYPKDKTPTTGCWCYLYLTRARNEKVVLVNFFPSKDIGYRWGGHQWDWEGELYSRENATMLDLR